MTWNADLGKETALVTGGTRNIGLAIAKSLRRAGARVCVVGATDKRALKQAVNELDPSGRKAMGSLTEVSNQAAVQGVFNRIEEQWGPVSILVNCAAVRPHEPFTAVTVDSWRKVLDVILTGAFLTSQELFRRLPANRLGAVVNLGGLSAHRPARDRAHVITAKSGLIGLTRALAEEGRPRIRANCVVPGVIDTRRKAGQPPPDFGAADAAHPSGTCEDVALAVLPLADPKHSYLTGQTIHVSGGRFMP